MTEHRSRHAAFAAKRHVTQPTTRPAPRLYYFANKTDLLVALHEHLAARWGNELATALGSSPDEATIDERIAIYAEVSSRSATGAELILMVEVSIHEDMRAPYSRVAAQWIPAAEQIREDDTAGLDRLIAVLAADGLWASGQITELRIPTHLSGVLTKRIGDLVNRHGV